MSWAIDNHKRLFGHEYETFNGYGPCGVCTADRIVGRLVTVEPLRLTPWLLPTQASGTDSQYLFL